MSVSGIGVDLPTMAGVQANGVSKITQVESGLSLRVDNSRLSAIIGDNVEVSDAAKWVSAAFEDFSRVDRLLYKGDTLKAFGEDYNRRRNLIIEAGNADEGLQVKQTELLDALDAEMSKRVSNFADEIVSLIDGIASKVAAGDKSMVASGWVEGYNGTEGLSLSKTEAAGIKSDIEQAFSTVMKAGDGSGGAGQPVFKGKYLSDKEFSGVSLATRIQAAAGELLLKQGTSSKMRHYEATWRTDDTSSFAVAWFNDVAFLEDTSKLDRISGGLRDVFGRLDSAASVHKSHSERLVEKDDKAGQSMLKASGGLEAKVIIECSKAFEKFAERIKDYAKTLTDQQKNLLGVLYLDAEKLGTENALKKVDAFAKALANNDFKGFRFNAEALNPKEMNLLHLLHWFKDDESTIGAADPIFTKGLSLQDRRALIAQKYLANELKHDEIHQENLASALAKLGKNN